jgi:predicted Zn-dependent protease
VETLRNDRLRARASLTLAFLLAACAAPTIQDEEELGRQQATVIRQEVLVMHDDVIATYVDDIGQRLVQASGPQPFEYTFTVIQDDELNAFANFGGQIYIHTGLITRTRNVSELAGAIGHEIGHIVNRDVAEGYARAKNAGLLRNAAVLGGIFGGVNPGAIDLLTGYGALGLINAFTREDEADADVFAVELLPRAGYDPEGVATLFETLTASTTRHVPKFFNNHPTGPERIAATRALLAAKQLPENLKRDDNGKLEIIQRRIRLLTKPPDPPRRRFAEAGAGSK